MPLILLFAVATLQSAEPIDLPALDTAIERCDRAAILPVFAAEARRRSAAVTTFYEEQARIAAERFDAANRRRALRESAAAPAQPQVAGGASDQELALRQMALDDRQRALDDQRRLETMRQEAIDLKRQYFLSRCPANRKSD